MCGDYLTVHISFKEAVKDEKQVSDISFEGDGCAILKASASMMTDLLLGKTVKEIEGLFILFQKIIHGEINFSDDLGQVNIFSGLGRFPSRIQCAILPWDTLVKGMRAQCLTE